MSTNTDLMCDMCCCPSNKIHCPYTSSKKRLTYVELWSSGEIIWVCNACTEANIIVKLACERPVLSTCDFTVVM
ncbi:MAG: hypothetical protein ACKPKO_15060 [Candidatus Fonsibacter sp.]